MNLKKQCGICKSVFLPELHMNVITFYENNTSELEVFEVCDNCFHFLQQVIEQAQTVTIDDIEKESGK